MYPMYSRKTGQPAYRQLSLRPVARTLAVTDHINVDLADDGSICGIESLSGPLTLNDAMAVLRAVPFADWQHQT